MLTTTDHDARLDHVITRAQRMGMEVAILEAIKLLQCRQHGDAAELLMQHRESVMKRAEVYWQAERAIDNARRETT